MKIHLLNEYGLDIPYNTIVHYADRHDDLKIQKWIDKKIEILESSRQNTFFLLQKEIQKKFNRKVPFIELNKFFTNSLDQRIKTYLQKKIGKTTCDELRTRVNKKFGITVDCKILKKYKSRQLTIKPCLQCRSKK